MALHRSHLMPYFTILYLERASSRSPLLFIVGQRSYSQMQFVDQFQSPNFVDKEIEVEFLILHYTACDLKKTLEIFLDPKTKVTSHFVIDRDGSCFDLGHFREGKIRKGAHAGASEIQTAGATYQSLNENSIGLEIVNFNGNLFEYSDAQYQTLSQLIRELQGRFPKLRSSTHIVGHEHIAAWRGKADPGLKFDWSRLFQSLGLKTEAIHLRHACEVEDMDFMKNAIDHVGGVDRADQILDFWPHLSASLERRIAARNSKKSVASSLGDPD